MEKKMSNSNTSQFIARKTHHRDTEDTEIFSVDLCASVVKLKPANYRNGPDAIARRPVVGRIDLEFRPGQTCANGDMVLIRSLWIKDGGCYGVGSLQRTAI